MIDKFQSGPVSEQTELTSWQGLSSGYSQSKWVGDTLARQAQARGLPVSIYRLSSVTGDRINAICNETDLIWRLVRLYAENPAKNWQPQAGPVHRFEVPSARSEFTR